MSVENENIDFICKEWLEIKRLSIKYSSYVKYEEIIKMYLMPFFKENDLKNINEVAIAKYFLDLSNVKKLSSSTLHSIKNVLSSIYLYGEQKYQFKHIDFSIVKIPSSKQTSKTLTDDQENALSNYCFSNCNSISIAILLGLYAGLRIGEICALQWTDIDFKQETISIKKTVQRLKSENDNSTKTELMLLSPKTVSSYRYVIIPKFLNEYLNKYSLYWKIEDTEQNNYLLSNSSEIIEPRTIQRRFEKTCEELGFKSNFHALRHTYATNCIKLGIDVKTVSEMLGHSNVSTTLNRYVHPSMEYKKEQINKFQLI